MALRRRTLLAGAGLGTMAPMIGRAAESRVLLLAMNATPAGFDPDFWVPGQIESTVNIYEGLVRQGMRTLPDGQQELDLQKFEPHLAESWTVSPDGTEYVFTIRPGVKSPFGNTLTAEDIAWTYRKSESQHRTGVFMRDVSQIAKVEVVAPDKVRFVLKVPNRIFLSVMALHIPGIFDSTEVMKHATTDDPFGTKWLSNHSAGFGPYHVESVTPGQQAVFVVNPNYAFEAPYFTRIIWRQVPSPATRVALLRTGQVNYAEQIPVQQVVDLRNDKAVRVEIIPGTASATVRMNPRYEPFGDVRVRQAVAYATDYKAIGEVVFRGIGERSRSVLAPKIPGFVPSYDYDTDYDRAKDLLGQAGHGGGLDIQLDYSTNWWWEEALAVQMQASLAKANIRCTPQRVAPTEMTARRATNVWTLPFLTHWAASFVADPTYNLFLSVHSKGGSNVNANNDPKLDSLIEQSVSEPDQTKWLTLIADAQREQARYCTIVETYLPGTIELFSAHVGGYVWFPHNRVAWKMLRAF